MNARLVIIFNIILFLYQFEFLSLDEGDVILSVYRLGILPLLIIYLLFNQSKFIKSDAPKYIITSIYFLFVIITLLGYGYFTYLTSVIGNILQLLVAYFYFRHYKIGKSTLLVLVTWGLFQLPYFIVDILTGNLGLANRFVGFHWDPNYLCMSLLISLWAKIYLLKYDISKLFKFTLIGLAIADVLMILFSLSRGGLLALLFTGLIYMFIYYRKFFYILSLGSISVISYMIERSSRIEWSYSLSLMDLIIFRVFTKAKEGDISANRFSFIDNYLEVLGNGEGVVFGMPLHYFIEFYNGGAFPHNSIIEILLPSGAIIGSVFYLLFLYSIFKLVYLSFVTKVLPYEVLFLISGLLVLLFLSFSLKISWLFVGLTFALSNKRVFKRHFII